MIELMDVEALIGRYAPMVLRRCRQLFKDEDEATDACQDVFVRLLERRGRIDAGHPSSLLYVMATHVCLNRIRDRSRHAVPAEDEELERIATAQTQEGESAARLLLDRLFRRQPASSRTMAVFHYLDGLTLEEVAAEVGLSVSGVAARKCSSTTRATPTRRGCSSATTATRTRACAIGSTRCPQALGLVLASTST